MTDTPSFYFSFDYTLFDENGDPMDISKVSRDEIAELVRAMYAIMLADREPPERVH